MSATAEIVPEDKILLICQAMGDASALLEVARELVSRGKQVHFLICGEGAYNRFEKPDAADDRSRFTITYLPDIAAGFEYGNSDLDPEQLAEVGQFFAPQEGAVSVAGILVGSPSPGYNASFQVAEALAITFPESRRLFSVDYLFGCVSPEDPENVVRRAISRPNLVRGANPYQLLLPTETSLARASARASELTADGITMRSIGHSAIDAAMRRAQDGVDSDAIAATRETLMLDGNKMVFISGLKTVADDLALLTTINNVVSSDPSVADGLQIRLGLHPGISGGNPGKENYLRTILTALQEPEFRHLRAIFSFVVHPDLYAYLRRDEEGALLGDAEFAESVADCFCVTDVNGNQASKAADGVMCAIPATLVSETAVFGKPAYSNDSERPSSLPSDLVYCGVGNMATFFAAVKHGGEGGYAVVPPSRAAIGVPETPMYETVADMLLS